jgi:hypothetical protein
MSNFHLIITVYSAFLSVDSNSFITVTILS